MLTVRKWVIRLAIILAVLVPLGLMAAALGSKFGLWSWQFGLGKLTFDYIPKKLAPLAILLGVIGLALALVVKPRKGWLTALIAIAIPAAVLYQAKGVRQTVAELPFIHDVTTDMENPPVFSQTLLDMRGPEANPAHYIGKEDPRGQALVSDLQKQGYPDIGPLILQADKDRVLNEIYTSVEELGWKVHTADSDSGIIEATDTTFWFGFKDDVIIRVSAMDDGRTRVDTRSLSRVGGSDIGANAARIKAFQAKLEGRI